MVSKQNLVHYTCIAHHSHHDDSGGDSVILAEYDSAGDSILNNLAEQCLDHTPPNHSNFTQTWNNRTYTFLLDYPFVYFGIFDTKFTKFDQLTLLGRLRDALNDIIKGDPSRTLTSFCLQGELRPVFHRLLSRNPDFHVDRNDNVDVDHCDGKGGISMVVGSSKERGVKGFGMLNCCTKNVKGVKKKRVSMCSSCGSSESVSESKEALMEGKVDGFDDNEGDVGVVKSRGIVCENGVCMLNGHSNGHGDGNGNGYARRQKAKKKWKQLVWIVLVFDLGVCLILFGIWLIVCPGFQCIAG
ncbi:hypothetical protein vseg_011973 [Gypsophila vaccaria]